MEVEDVPEGEERVEEQLLSCSDGDSAADVPEEDILNAIKKLEEKFQSDDFSFQIFKIFAF